MDIYHKHHIIPKHAGGTDDPSNIVQLSIEEHAEAHRILFEQYGRIQDKLAWKGLLGMIDTQEIIYELSKQPKSQEHKLHLSKIKKGSANAYDPNNGVFISRISTDDPRWKTGLVVGSNKNKKTPHSKPSKMKNVPKSKEHNTKNALAQRKNILNGTHPTTKFWKCSCGKEGRGLSNFSRYHKMCEPINQF